MLHSPPNTRSRKDKKPERTLSVDSAPAADKEEMESAAIEACLSKLLSGDQLLDKLVAKLAPRLETIIADAVAKSLTAVLERVTELEKEVDHLQKAVQELNSRWKCRTDELEQYQRRNNLRVFGISETAKEDTDKLVIALFKEKLGVDIPECRLDRSHRLGKIRVPEPGQKKRPRPIIVRFTSYRDRRQVFTSKKKWKDSGFSIQEDLTSDRQELLKRAAEVFGKDKTWTLDGRVMWLDKDGVKGVATNLAELNLQLL